MQKNSTGALPGYLAGWIEFTLARASQRSKDLFEQALSPLGLRSKHYAVLALLRENGDLSQQAAGQRLGIDRTTMVTVIDDLERSEYAERNPKPEDRRSYIVRLTSKGEQALVRADSAIASAENELLAQLSTAERRQLHLLLGKISLGK